MKVNTSQLQSPHARACLSTEARRMPPPRQLFRQDRKVEALSLLLAFLFHSAISALFHCKAWHETRRHLLILDSRLLVDVWQIGANNLLMAKTCTADLSSSRGTKDQGSNRKASMPVPSLKLGQLDSSAQLHMSHSGQSSLSWQLY